MIIVDTQRVVLEIRESDWFSRCCLFADRTLLFVLVVTVWYVINRTGS